MKTVFYKTENAEFEYSQKDFNDQYKLQKNEYDIEECSNLYVLLELIDAGRVTVACKVCDKMYDANQLKQFAIGHGKSPFYVKTGMKGGVKRIFAKKRRIPMFGGKGFKCPEGHKLISMETWRT